MKQVLFICTGNFYRSRFAEALINHYAPLQQLPWRAFSRGLAVKEQGDLSPHTRSALESRGIDHGHTSPYPRDLSEACLAAAAKVIAMKEEEHRPLMQERFPHWVDRITYWQVGDTDAWEPHHTITHIEDSVERLIRNLM
jgi:protein-tyrosine phosphatase